MHEVFCKRNESDKRLLRILNEAYLDARYKEENYAVSGEEVELILGKLKRMQEVFAKL
jgi:hypothetical protein